MMASSRKRLFGDDAEIAGSRRLVLHRGRQRQRFEIAAHRRQRRHQLVRDVGQQLPPRSIGVAQFLDASVQVGGHAVEAAGQRGHFVTAVLGRADGGLAGADRGRGLLQAAQPAMDRAEHQDGHHPGAGDEQRQARPTISVGPNSASSGSRPAGSRQHADHGHRPSAHDDRLERRPPRPRPGRPSARGGPQAAARGPAASASSSGTRARNRANPHQERRHLERAAAVHAIVAHDEHAVRAAAELARQPGVDVEAWRRRRGRCSARRRPRSRCAPAACRWRLADRRQPEEQRRLQRRAPPATVATKPSAMRQ